ncbi:MAG: cyclic nucleotide-binding domain-containing protein [Gemmatimonadota bacterium]|nr:cyclic nucleotide-binding domain-containing protein [Gemmatimonadota bacterium]
MPLAELFGWLAAVLVFTAFWSTTMVRLRMVAMASNVAFIVYGVMLGAPSIIALHGVLLPLNGWKLIRLRQLAALVRRASRGPMTLEMLVPAMEQQRYGAGAILFRQGDPADHVFFVIDGTLRVVEAEDLIGPGELVGEMGLFAADSRRTATVVAETDVRCGRIAADRFWELFLRDPELGGFVVRTIVQRLAGTPHTESS